MPQKVRKQKQTELEIQRSHLERCSGLLDVEGIANVLGCAEATIRMKVWKREIEFVRIGRSIRFRPEMVERLIEENTVPAFPDSGNGRRKS
jgi:excisionase family DNA binding protein